MILVLVNILPGGVEDYSRIESSRLNLASLSSSKILNSSYDLTVTNDARYHHLTNDARYHSINDARYAARYRPIAGDRPDVQMRRSISDWVRRT